MKDAMRAKDVARLSAIRLLLAAINQREIDDLIYQNHSPRLLLATINQREIGKRAELPDSSIINVIEKMLKQRRDSISQFAAAGRQDLVDKEIFEVGVLQPYLPKPLSEDDVDEEIGRALQASGAKTIQDMGKVMAILKPLLVGRADMARVSALIKSKLIAQSYL